MTAVQPSAWAATLAGLVGEGYTFLDLITAVDRGAGVEVVARVMAPDTLEAVVVTTVVPDTDLHLPSVVRILPGAAWHERETAEMFGLTFDGHPAPGPLLLRRAPDRPPLRSATPLAARLALPWPGAAEADGGRRARRRTLPPGVRESWMEAAE